MQADDAGAVLLQITVIAKKFIDYQVKQQAKAKPFYSAPA
jgi:hypothetical protein